MTHADIIDARGLPLTAPGATAVERLEGIIDDIYYYRLGVPDRLDALLQEYPDFVLAHVLKGYSLMSEGTLDAHPKARARLQQAEALPANPRERLHLEALRAWIAQDFSARAAAWERILVEWPLDLLAFRQYTGTLFWSGDKRHQAEVTRGSRRPLGPADAGLCALSFGACLRDGRGRPLRGGRALRARGTGAAAAGSVGPAWPGPRVRDAGSRRAKASNCSSDAARFLDDYNLFRGHLWWHLSLFKFSQGRFDEVLDLFDREIYPQSSTFYLDIQNGASLLARLEFQGVDVGLARWERLAQASLPSATQSTIWFTAMHHVMALMRSGRGIGGAVNARIPALCGARLRTGGAGARARPEPRRLSTRTSPAKRSSGCWPYVSATANSARAMPSRTSMTRSWSWLPCSSAICRACVSCSRPA